MNDSVNHPNHYTAYEGLEVIDLTEYMSFNLGNAVKYIARAGMKNPSKEREDLEKAAWYITREMQRKNLGCGLSSEKKKLGFLLADQMNYLRGGAIRCLMSPKPTYADLSLLDLKLALTHITMEIDRLGEWDAS